MKNRRAYADEGSAYEQHFEAGGAREDDQARERKAHADGERKRFWMLVRIDADKGLQQRGGDLVGEADEAELSEIEVQRFLQVWINRDD